MSENTKTMKMTRAERRAAASVPLTGPALWLKAARRWNGAGANVRQILMAPATGMSVGFGLPANVADAVIAEMRRQLAEEAAAEAARPKPQVEASSETGMASFSKDAGESGNEDGAWGSSSHDGWRVD